MAGPFLDRFGLNYYMQRIVGWLGRGDRTLAIVRYANHRGEHSEFASWLLGDKGYNLSVLNQSSGFLAGAWQREGSEHGAPLESGARFAFALFRDLAHKSVANRLPMLLAYQPHRYGQTQLVETE